MYTVIQKDENGDLFYLNHSCMSTLSFGSEDMAWTTDDKEKAELMADKCINNSRSLYNADCEIYASELY